MKGRVLAAAGAALALITGGAAYAAVAATSSPTAACTVTNPSPSVTTGTGGTMSFSSGVTCTATVPAQTVTVTQTQGASSTTSPAPTSTTTSPTSPPTTAAPPASSTTSSPSSTAGSTGWVRPSSSTTGYSGTLKPWSGSTTFTANNQTISNVDFGGYIKVTGSNLTLENCHFSGMVYFGPGPLTIKNCTSNGNINSDSTYRAINGVTYDHVHVICGAHDGIDAFSSNGHVESNIMVTDTLIDGMNFPAGSTSHGDGLQVRGVNGLTVQRTVINDGPYQSQDNSAIYFENVSGGDANMHLSDLDLYGGGYTFYTNAVSSSSATNVAIKAAGHWGAYHANVHPSGWAFTNVTGPTGAQIAP